MSRVGSAGNIAGAPVGEDEGLRTARRTSPTSARHSFEAHSTTGQLGALVSYADELQAKFLPSFLHAAGM